MTSPSPRRPRRGSLQSTVVRWVLKPALWIGCLAPAAWLARGVATLDLGADPVKTLTHTTGLTALILLLLTLTVTPARRLSGVDALIALRRPLGLFAFFYATVHLLIYAVFDHRFDPAEIAADIVEHPWVLVGFAAFLILLTLALTSPPPVVRRLGGRNWNRLHRLIYPAAGLAVLHFFWLVKKDTREPVLYGAILLLILACRFFIRPTRRPRTAAPE